MQGSERVTGNLTKHSTRVVGGEVNRVHGHAAAVETAAGDSQCHTQQGAAVGVHVGDENQEECCAAKQHRLHAQDEQ